MLKALAILLVSATAARAGDGQIRSVDMQALPLQALHEGEGKVAFLALDQQNLPLVALIRFAEGDAQAPYTVNDGRTRFAFVTEGEIAFGEGATVDQANEKTYKKGDIIVIPAGAPFWVGAREGGLPGAEIVIAIVPGDSRVNAPLH